MKQEYIVVTRNIKNPRLEFKCGNLFVIVPKTGSFDVEGFVSRHARWIAKHAAYYKNLQEEVVGLEPTARLSEDFTKLVEQFIQEGSALLGISPQKIKYKNLKTRWGSCTRTGDVTINLKLRYFPDHLIWYVVFHELVHLRVLSHSQEFYVLLQEVFPDHKQYDQQLRGYEYMLAKNTFGN